jgi:uncharacterized membrane protein YgdD (TMEM256/DUF423 family)
MNKIIGDGHLKLKNQGYFLVFIGISGAFSVLFSAWLSHGASFLSHHAQSSLKTAVYYQLIHTVVLLFVWLYSQLNPHRVMVIIGSGFMSGIMLFSGSIYVKYLLPFTTVSLAPLGGLLLAMAWLLLAFIPFILNQSSGTKS